MPYILGIDLGTTNSAMAILRGGQPEIVVNAEGERVTPSVVSLTADGELIVGRPAKRQAVLRPDETVLSIKRQMGTDHQTRLGGKSYTPPEISALILRKMRKDAEARLGEPITKAVITCPAYFTDAQRQATKDAGRIAGLEVLRIINEPTAAALAHGFQDKKEKKIMVFDLGGGTFDVSVLETGDGVFEVKATSGDNRLGGDDWDARLQKHLVEQVRKRSGVDASKDRQALQRLREAAENAKIELSSKRSTQVSLPFIAQKSGQPVHLDLELTRAEAESLCADLLARLEGPTKTALADAGIQQGQLDAVLMVGGMTRMPAVQEIAYRLTGVRPDLSVNPDEAVALGAAIQAGVITGEVTDLVLLDVTPLTLGIETVGNRFTPIVDRNTTIPVTRSKVFTTAADGQTQVEVHVLQGERPLASGNKTLGRFHLEGIPPAPRGVPQIEVSFDIDVNGIVHVSAKDRATGRQQRTSITDAVRLSDAEIERMRKEAERFEAEDKARADEVDARNEADSALYQARKALRETKDVPAEAGAAVEGAIADLEEAITAKAAAGTLRDKTQALQQALMKVGEAVYSRAAGASAGEAPGPGAPEPGPRPKPHVDPSRLKTKKGEGDEGVDVEYEEPDK